MRCVRSCSTTSRSSTSRAIRTSCARVTCGATGSCCACAARRADGLYTRALAGDVLHKKPGGMFTCEDAAVDGARLAAGELVVTGPMFGDRMRAATGDAGAREEAVLAAAGLTRDSFASVR